MARTLNYWEAAYPDPFTILGLRLKPFSLGHYFILRRLNCAFVSDAETVADKSDLLLATVVCSMSPEEFLQFLDQKPGGITASLSELKRAGMRAAWGALWRRSFWQEIAAWARRVGEFNFQEKAELLRAYIEVQTEQPAYWIEKEDDHGAGGHWSHCLMHALISQCGYTLEQALSAPISQCLQDYFKRAEATGAVRLLTPEEMKEAQDGVPA